MEHILISENKLKVTLDAADMKNLSLSCDDIDYDNTETRRALWSILDEAKHKTGFDAASKRVFIQVYPSKGGGCELYVTKLSADNTQTAARNRVTIEHSGTVNSDDINIHKKNSIAVEFETISQLTACCRRLTADGYLGASNAYCDQNRRKTRYLMLLDGVIDHDVIREYGSLLDPETIHIWVGEHCDEIRKIDAVETLSRL